MIEIFEFEQIGPAIIEKYSSTISYHINDKKLLLGVFKPTGIVYTLLNGFCHACAFMGFQAHVTMDIFAFSLCASTSASCIKAPNKLNKILSYYFIPKMSQQ